MHVSVCNIYTLYICIPNTYVYILHIRKKICINNIYNLFSLFYAQQWEDNLLSSLCCQAWQAEQWKAELVFNCGNNRVECNITGQIILKGEWQRWFVTRHALIESAGIVFTCTDYRSNNVGIIDRLARIKWTDIVNISADLRNGAFWTR